MADRRPMAFMSYAHIDDRLNKGYLFELQQRLSEEICLYLGEEFPIFLERKDIKWGDSWKERIEDSIDSTAFLIPIITPGYFKSQYCRDELSRFLERERRLKRTDLILPVYFVDTPLMEDEMKRNNDELARIIASRQYVDWRALRFADLDSIAVRQALALLAAQIRDALETPVPIHLETKPIAAVSEETTERKKTRIETPVIVVDRLHRGDFTAITDANREGIKTSFDVFLCYNREDIISVKNVANELKKNQIIPWLDEWELRPGLPWQEILDDQIENIDSVAVFVGKGGLGPWQDQEIRAFLQEFVKRKCPVIPVILLETRDVPKLPIFLRSFTWVDFRKKDPDPMKSLIWGITGKKRD